MSPEEKKELKNREHTLENELREIRKQLVKDSNDKIKENIERNKQFLGKWFKDLDGNYYFPTRPVRVEWSMRHNFYDANTLQGIILMPKEVKNYSMDDFVIFDDIPRYILEIKCVEVPPEEVLLAFQDSLTEGVTVGKNYVPSL